MALVLSCVRGAVGWASMVAAPAGVAFDAFDDAIHHVDGFEGVLAGGGFGAEHDGVGAVEHGCGDVAGFGAGWGRGR